jgi:hypothetical protein
MLINLFYAVIHRTIKDDQIEEFKEDYFALERPQENIFRIKQMDDLIITLFNERRHFLKNREPDEINSDEEI